MAPAIPQQGGAISESPAAALGCAKLDSILRDARGPEPPNHRAEAWRFRDRLFLQAMRAPCRLGNAANDKVHVLLTTGHERGSNAVTVSRPA